MARSRPAQLAGMLADRPAFPQAGHNENPSRERLADLALASHSLPGYHPTSRERLADLALAIPLGADARAGEDRLGLGLGLGVGVRLRLRVRVRG